MTLTQFAKLCHVSVSTASKAFSMSHDISNATRGEIFKIAREQNCFKKFFNAPYKNLMIGVIIPEFNSYTYSNTVNHIQTALEKIGSEICVSATNFSKEKETELIEYYCKYSAADGIIIASPQNTFFEKLDIPTVVISVKPFKNNMNVIVSEMDKAYFDAVQFIHEQGVKKIGYIGEIKSKARFERFSEAMKKIYGTLDEDYIEIGVERFEKGGYNCMEKLFSNGKIPEAIFCSYDHMALGAMKCITEHGLKIPDDIAVIGEDNIAQAKFLTPELSSISLDYEKISDSATDMIISEITGKETEKSVSVPAKFHIRKSFIK